MGQLVVFDATRNEPGSERHRNLCKDYYSVNWFIILVIRII